METDRVYQRLLNLILSLRLEPGSTVTQAYLGDLLECGRTPLREATQRLMVEGLVVHTPNRGISVAPLDIRHLAQAEEAYRCVHTEAVRCAAVRRTDAQLAALQAVLDRAGPLLADDPKSEGASLDVEFHCLLAEASQNQFLADASSRMEKLLVRFVSLTYVSTDVHREVWDYHQRILDAVRDRCPDEAGRLLGEHIDLARRHILAALRMAEAPLSTVRG